MIGFLLVFYREIMLLQRLNPLPNQRHAFLVRSFSPHFGRHNSWVVRLLSWIFKFKPEVMAGPFGL